MKEYRSRNDRKKEGKMESNSQQVTERARESQENQKQQGSAHRLHALIGGWLRYSLKVSGARGPSATSQGSVAGS